MLFMLYYLLFIYYELMSFCGYIINIIQIKAGLFEGQQHLQWQILTLTILEYTENIVLNQNLTI